MSAAYPGGVWGGSPTSTSGCRSASEITASAISAHSSGVWGGSPTNTSGCRSASEITAMCDFRAL